MTREKALQLRALLVKASASLSDEDALDGIELFAPWQMDTWYTRGTRLRYGDKLYRVEQDHTSKADWLPDITPALYTEVAKPGEIPVWKQPTGAQDAYNKGDKVHYPDSDSPVYVSTIDNNVWSPDAYPQGWEVDT